MFFCFPLELFFCCRLDLVVKYGCTRYMVFFCFGFNLVVKVFFCFGLNVLDGWRSQVVEDGIQV